VRKGNPDTRRRSAGKSPYNGKKVKNVERNPGLDKGTASQARKQTQKGLKEKTLMGKEQAHTGETQREFGPSGENSKGVSEKMPEG